MVLLGKFSLRPQRLWLSCEQLEVLWTLSNAIMLMIQVVPGWDGWGDEIAGDSGAVQGARHNGGDDGDVRVPDARHWPRGRGAAAARVRGAARGGRARARARLLAQRHALGRPSAHRHTLRTAQEEVQAPQQHLRAPTGTRTHIHPHRTHKYTLASFFSNGHMLLAWEIFTALPSLEGECHEVAEPQLKLLPEIHPSAHSFICVLWTYALCCCTNSTNDPYNTKLWHIYYTITIYVL